MQIQLKFHFDLARIEIFGNNSNARLNILDTTKRNFPLKIDMLWKCILLVLKFFCHMKKTNFIVVVAPGVDKA